MICFLAVRAPGSTSATTPLRPRANGSRIRDPGGSPAQPGDRSGSVEAARGDPGDASHTWSPWPMVKTLLKDVLAIATPILQSRIAGAEHRSSAAVSLLRQAVAAEDRLAYDEPKDWRFPACHLLGAELLRAGEAAEAEQVYREDLRQNPANGWSLYGLSAVIECRQSEVQSGCLPSRLFSNTLPVTASTPTS